jgi:hypothetical protein
MRVAVSSGMLQAIVNIGLSIAMVALGVSLLFYPHRRLILPTALVMALQGLRMIRPCLRAMYVLQLAQQSNTELDEDIGAGMVVIVICTLLIWYGVIVSVKAWAQIRSVLNDPNVPDHDKPTLLNYRRQPSEAASDSSPATIGATASEATSDSSPAITEHTTFAGWYASALGHIPVVLQGLLWISYGFIWIPVWYWLRKGSFADWYRGRLGRFPGLVQGLLWLFYGFLWIPVWYWCTKSRK